MARRPTDGLAGEHARRRYLARATIGGDHGHRTRLRAIHAVSVDDTARGVGVMAPAHAAPTETAAAGFLDPVLVHGDACAPNTLISHDGASVGNVDFGDLAVGDRWADLAIASMSLDWNFGEGHQDEFFTAYGIGRDRRTHPVLPRALGSRILNHSSRPSSRPHANSEGRERIPVGQGKLSASGGPSASDKYENYSSFRGPRNHARRAGPGAAQDSPRVRFAPPLLGTYRG